MAVSITVETVLVAARVVTDAEAIPPPVKAAADVLYAGAVAIIQEYAPVAPADVQNTALVRLFGWLWDADAADATLGRALQVSGTANLLSPWRVHRAGAVGVTGTPTPAPTPSGIPTPPAEGHFILTVTNGVLSWVAFPQP